MLVGRICVSPKGYTDGDLSLAYLQFFDEQTREKANGRYRRLIVDNFNSHCTLYFLEYARANKIIIVAYPPHCTHALQGLDVVIFARLKQLWGSKLRALEKENNRVTKATFLRTYGEVREGAFTTDNVLSAFRSTGIRPFNPSVITPDQLAPSLATSTEYTGPIELPPVIKDIREALKLHRIHSRASGTSEFTGKESGSYSSASSLPPSSPLAGQTARRISSVVSGSEYAYLSYADSDSFSSSTPIPDLFISPLRHSEPGHPEFLPEIDPDLLSPASLRIHLKRSLAKNQYFAEKTDRMEANLFAYSQYCETSQKRLYYKENKPKTTREKLANAGQRHMTADAWIAALREDEEQRERTDTLESRYRKWRADEANIRKETNARIENEWKVYKEPFVQQKVRPPNKKPALVKRAATPAEFWEVRKRRKGTGDVDDEAEEVAEESDKQ